MKIVFASIPSQEKEICGLVRYIYSSIFPRYFTDDEIDYFDRLKVLHTTSKDFERFSTLRDAFQVMTSIRTLISILESPVLNNHYVELFNKNAANLQEFGLFFPFELDQFVQAKDMKCSVLSMYTKPDNELLV